MHVFGDKLLGISVGAFFCRGPKQGFEETGKNRILYNDRRSSAVLAEEVEVRGII